MTDRPWRDDEEDWTETGDDEFDAEDSADDDAVPCPECGAAIYDDLDHCPQCGYWLTDADRRDLDDSLFSSRSVRIIAAALLIIFALGLIASVLEL